MLQKGEFMDDVMMQKRKLVLFTSMSKEGGGSGTEKVVEYTQDPSCVYEVVAIVSNHEDGRESERCERIQKISPNTKFIYSNFSDIALSRE